MIKTCANCGEEFEACDNRTKYCSVECRKEQTFVKRKEKYHQQKLFVEEWEAWKTDFLSKKESIKMNGADLNR